MQTWKVSVHAVHKFETTAKAVFEIEVFAEGPLAACVKAGQQLDDNWIVTNADATNRAG